MRMCCNMSHSLCGSFPHDASGYWFHCVSGSFSHRIYDFMILKYVLLCCLHNFITFCKLRFKWNKMKLSLTFVGYVVWSDRMVVLYQSSDPAFACTQENVFRLKYTSSKVCITNGCALICLHWALFLRCRVTAGHLTSDTADPFSVWSVIMLYTGHWSWLSVTFLEPSWTTFWIFYEAPLRMLHMHFSLMLHVLPISLSLKISGKEHRLWNSALCGFVQSFQLLPDRCSHSQHCWQGWESSMEGSHTRLVCVRDQPSYTYKTVAGA
jgi:hypothetical protein